MKEELSFSKSQAIEYANKIRELVSLGFHLTERSEMPPKTFKVRNEWQFNIIIIEKDIDCPGQDYLSLGVG